ncbi:unnamed protein product [Polarella glacialis]|uniref:Uncharacterized protein n=1 Tax=Polarella glacialis TaxID=89957 RepID=A0A813JX83_POLGL|nr:unnamed protein product [Polarella glacialis]
MASRCRQWLLLGAALALLPGLQGDDTISPPADSDPRGNILQCGSEEKERWLRVKKHLDVMVPRLTGRLNFVALREDIPILEAIQTELLDGLGIPQEMLKADSPMPSWVAAQVELLDVIVVARNQDRQGLNPSIKLPSRATAMVLAFEDMYCYCTRSRWLVAVPLGRVSFALNLVLHLAPMVELRDPQPESWKVCLWMSSVKYNALVDDGVFGVVTWSPPEGAVNQRQEETPEASIMKAPSCESADPEFAEEAPESAEGQEVEEALAGHSLSHRGLRGKVWGGDAGRCRWSEHRGRYLGRRLGSVVNLSDVAVSQTPTLLS